MLRALTFVGFGAIGKYCAKLCRAAGMKVVGVSRSGRADPAADECHKVAALHSLLPLADVVVLALPLDASTKHIINALELGLMKKSAFLVNVARGGHINQDALVKAAGLGLGLLLVLALERFRRYALLS